jgi:hypothetical protein
VSGVIATNVALPDKPPYASVGVCCWWYNFLMYSRKYFSYGMAWTIAALLAASALVYKFYIPHGDPRPIPILGAPGSTHAHVSLLVADRDKPISFCEQKYMLASQLVHFEDANCTVVHKHATGVTLDTFFKTIEVSLTEKCLVIPNMKPLCNDGKNTLRIVLNGVEMPIGKLQYYELQDRDHILLNYGPESGALLRFKYNQVPSIPEGITNEPLF